MNKKICPKCKSHNIQIYINPITGGGTDVCNECGYQLLVFPEKIKSNKNKKLK